MTAPRLSALALVAALACAGAAQAQEPPAAAAPAAHQGWDRAQMRERMEARRAEHIKAIHDALNIRPDQESAFSAFAAAMHPQDRDGGAKHDGMTHDRAAMAAMTTPERLDRMAQKMDERTARMHADFQRRADAAKALYAALGPDQRRTMDALHGLMGHERGKGMERHHRGEEHGQG